MEKNMTISEYQKHLDTILQEYEKPYWSPLSNVAHLVEEVGEVARVMNHLYGDKPKKSSESPDDLADELGDVLFTLVCIANAEGVDLQLQADKAIEKLTVRDKDRFAKKK
jgi:NTP pyrophosphatase (non-canonical NTP hydrolase)